MIRIGTRQFDGARCAHALIVAPIQAERLTRIEVQTDSWVKPAVAVITVQVARHQCIVGYIQTRS